MKQTFNVGDRIICNDPVGELVENKVYTVRKRNHTTLYLEESTFSYFNYASYRFSLYEDKEPTFDEQIKLAQSFIGKKVQYKDITIEVRSIKLFIKGIYDDNISGLVQDVLKEKEWCLAVLASGHTIPLQQISVINSVTVKNVGEYEAQVHKDHVMVGCQKISKAKFDEIAKAFESLQLKPE